MMNKTEIFNQIKKQDILDKALQVYSLKAIMV